MATQEVEIDEEVLYIRDTERHTYYNINLKNQSIKYQEYYGQGPLFATDHLQFQVFFLDPSKTELEIINTEDGRFFLDIETNNCNLSLPLEGHAKHKLVKILKTRMHRQSKRNLRMVKHIGKERNLPENMESVIGSYLSGKKGSINAQTNKLNQNIGMSLAPRPGGGAKTRKRTSRKSGGHSTLEMNKNPQLI